MKPAYQMLREYREARGITQTHIAKKTGKTVQRISALETGGIRLTADELVELCLTGYEVSPANFCRELLGFREPEGGRLPEVRTSLYQ